MSELAKPQPDRAPGLEVLELDGPRWDQALAECAPFDIYHLAQYHRIAEGLGEGLPSALIYWDGPFQIFFPLLLRPIAEVPGLERVADWDVTSVQGYAGPVASHRDVPTDVCARFREALRAWLRDRGVVSVFARLHPPIPQAALIEGLGEMRSLGTTVSIDLGLDEEEQWRQYRGNHRSNIRRLMRRGGLVQRDADWQRLDDFISIYHETMDRVGASSAYYFDRAYFEAMRETMGDYVHLFVCELEGEPICAGLFSKCGGIAQYHLGGTRTAFLKLAPMKLMFDQVARWARRQGAEHFHIGGGVGSREDRLYDFKRGFSDRSHAFEVWQWVLDPKRYAELCAEAGDGGASNDTSGFFPRYRDPDLRAVPEPSQPQSSAA